MSVLRLKISLRRFLQRTAMKLLIAERLPLIKMTIILISSALQQRQFPRICRVGGLSSEDQDRERLSLLTNLRAFAAHYFIRRQFRLRQPTSPEESVMIRLRLSV